MKKWILKTAPFWILGSIISIGLISLPGSSRADRRAPDTPLKQAAASTPDREGPPLGGPKVLSTKTFRIAAKDLVRPRQGGSPSPAYISKGIRWALGAHSPDPAWSFDGTRIAYHDGVCITIRKTDGALDRLLRPKGKARKHMGEGCRSPRWSHDDKRIVASHSFHGPGMLFEVGSKRGRLLSPRGNGLWSLSFIPGDRYLIGRVHQTGVGMIPVANPTKILALTSKHVSTMQGFFPSFSPDGKYAVRLLGDAWSDSARLEIITIGSDRPKRGSTKDPWENLNKKGDYPAIVGEQSLTVETGAPVMDYAWGPDGTRLVAVVSKWYGGYDQYFYKPGELVFIDVAGGNLTRTGVIGSNPVWSPDGRYIAFDRPEKGIFLMAATGGDYRPWKLHPRGMEPRWSPKADILFVLDPADGSGKLLTLTR
ncbi:MAG: PD40 domain-containing protein [Deltaproteobacteria bacterium]|nr:PD40 domain-containing protein [Deltaproteobacteria bacterium]MBW1871651.1 PD40 domain-containing protein [Deltaproteobacteria bacterium]